MANSEPFRLPRTADPEHYDLTFTLDLDEARFTGEERVRVRVHEPLTQVVLNALDLEIHGAELVDEAGASLEATVELDAGEERAVLTLPGPAAPGLHTLHLTFSGRLSDKLRGIYRSLFQDEAGTTRTIAATQFEATDARRAFPCWDEPDRKATFSTTLIVDADLTAVSNSEVVEVTDLGNGRRQVEFAPTMKMSTYLVAFVVGPLELTDPVDVDGVPLRVAAVPGKAHLAGFALDVGAHALRFFARYFDVPYPARKLDLIALPDFAMGAMENLGAVTFRETLLLVDPDRATRVELERVADVIAHEIAHMWFGDLVTMKWWNGIWLNEAFATFMELLCVDAFRPEWERWVSFAVSRGGAMVTDGLASTRPIEFPVQRPEDAEGMFDVLTYQKGAAVLRMLERYVGADSFRAGIASYIRAHSHANTETSDLWDAIEAATGEPARKTMDSWIFQGGYPLVSVEPAPDGGGVVLAQQRFRYLDAGEDGAAPTWQVPVLLRAGVDGEVVHRRMLLDGDAATVDLGDKVEWVVVNEGGWGFYRVRYLGDLLTRLTSDLGQLDALERFGVVSDTWASVLAGFTSVADFLDLARLLGDESDRNVWSAVLSALGYLDRVIPAEDRPRLQGFVRRLVGPAFEQLGWSPAAGEGETTRSLRAVLLQGLGVLGADDGVRARAAEVHDQHVRDPASVDADVAGAAVAVVAAAGGHGRYEEFLDRFRSAPTPQEEVRYLYALAGFEDPELVRRTFELAAGEVRTQNAPFLISLLLSNRAGGELTWGLVKQRWAELTDRLPDALHDRMIEGVTALSTPELAADVRAFLEAHPLPGRQRTVEQILERLDIAVAFRRREAAGLPALLDAG